MKKILLGSIALLFAIATNSYATPVAGVLDYFVSGSDMAGMLVTVEYDDGSLQTAEWQAGIGNEGAAVGTDWMLGFNGSDTSFSNYLDDFLEPGVPNIPDRRAYWEFETTGAIASIKIDAIGGNTVFDIFAIWDDAGIETGFPNTVGSADGWWQANSFLSTDTSGFDSFSWEFTDPITINGVVAEDLFGSLDIDFDNPSTAWTDLMTGNFSFGVDTDLVQPVPEPATMILLCTGLLGLLGFSLRRRR